jgi:hypothetical protein
MTRLKKRSKYLNQQVCIGRIRAPSFRQVRKVGPDPIQAD